MPRKEIYDLNPNSYASSAASFSISENDQLELVNYLSKGFEPDEESLEKFGYYEFFCGGGMARLGLGKPWRAIFSNDWDQIKAEAYLQNFGRQTNFTFGDVNNIKVGQLPGKAALAWASFPCQDLSLAGNGDGLNGKKSGAFWGFARLVQELKKENRAPEILVLENVIGTLTSHGGSDFSEIISFLVSQNYRCGALVVDGAHFVPQSRPRLFFICIKKETETIEFESVAPRKPWHTDALSRAYQGLGKKEKKNWIWWDLPAPALRKESLQDIVIRENSGVAWHSEFETKKILSMMSDKNLEKVRNIRKSNRFAVGAIYKRTRIEYGKKFQRAEIRFDGLSGCLRTPSGGSSRQILAFFEDGKIRTRLLAPREAARLMGVPDTYKLPESYNPAYHLMGDGLVVPAIAWIEKKILRPIVKKISFEMRSAA